MSPTYRSTTWALEALGVAVFAALLSGCGSTGPIYLADVEQARVALAQGNSQLAVVQLESIAEKHPIEDGSVDEQIGFQGTYGEALIAIGIQQEPAFLPEQLSTSEELERERKVKEADSTYRKARARFQEVMSLLTSETAKERSPEQNRRDEYSAMLGVGFTYLRQGILFRNPSFLQRAETELDRAADLAKGDTRLTGEPRLLHYRSRLVQAFAGQSVNRDLVKDILKRFHVFHQRQREEGFNDHLAYRDLLDHVHEANTPARVATLADGPEGDALKELTEQYIGWLSDYHENQPQIPSEWGVFPERLNEFFESHQRWRKLAAFADRTLARAAEVSRQAGVPVTTYRQLVENLENVDEEFWSDEYRRERVTIQTDYVKELLREAQDHMQLGKYEEAQESVRVAKRYATSEFVPGPQRDRCDEALDRINGRQAFAALNESVKKALAAEGVERAQEVLKIAGSNPALLNDEYRDRIQALYDEITQNDKAVTQAYRLIAELDSAKTPGERLQKAEELDRIVRENELATMSTEATRRYRDALLENDRFVEAREATQPFLNRQQLDPSDKIALGLCHFSESDWSQSAKYFNEVGPSVLRETRLGERALRAAAEANLKANLPTQSYQFYKQLQATANVDTSVTRGLIESCRLALRSDLSASDEKEWRTRWNQEEPRQVENLKQLVRITYRLGTDALARGDEENGPSAGEPHFVEAYRYLLKYLQLENYATLPRDEQKMADRLFASYADYMPLHAGDRYTYEHQGDGTLRHEDRIRGETDNFDVDISVDSAKIEERWLKLRNKLIRAPRRGGANRLLLIRIPHPEAADFSDDWGRNQRVEVTQVGQEFQSGADTHQHCIVVRVYSGTGARDYYEYTLAPEVGIVKEVNAANNDVFVLQRYGKSPDLP